MGTAQYRLPDGLDEIHDSAGTQNLSIMRLEDGTKSWTVKPVRRAVTEASNEQEHT